MNAGTFYVVIAVEVGILAFAALIGLFR